MLGEDHSLIIEFPELKEKIIALTKDNEQFAHDSKKYHELDKEIRELELANSPIEDGELHSLKHFRAELKDSLYQRIQTLA